MRKVQMLTEGAKHQSCGGNLSSISCQLSSAPSSITYHLSTINCAKRVFDVEIEGLEKVRESLGDAFAATVELMMSTLEAGGLVVVTGVGKSLQVAEKMSAVFASTGTRSIVLNPEIGRAHV